MEEQLASSERPSQGTLTDTSDHMTSSLPIPVPRPDPEKTAADGNEGHTFEVQWDGGDADPCNPRSFPAAKKWGIFLVASMGILGVTFTSSVYTCTFAQITEEFGASELVATVGLSLFILGLAFGPTVLGPLSEFYGRRPIYILSLASSLITLIPQAAARNIETMLVGRFLCGFASSAYMAVAGGSAGDLFGRDHLQRPMVVLTTFSFVGGPLGLPVGGFINRYANWRWTFYVLLVWFALNLAITVLLVPETYHPVLLREKARMMRAQTGEGRWYAPIEKDKRSIARTVVIATQRPFAMLLLDPMCLYLCILTALILGITYLFLGAFNVVFAGTYGFDLRQVGLTFLGQLVGGVIGGLCDPIVRWNYLRLNKRREEATGEIGGSEPEYRLPPAMVGTIISTVGLFMFAWTCYPNVHWIFPVIGSGIFGIGSELITIGVFTFNVDAYPRYAASAFAANTFMRCIFGAVFPLFGIQMYKKLGNQWASSLLGFFTLVLVPFPFLFYRYGKQIRKKSRFASD